MTAVTPDTKLPAKASRWDSLVWPRWLPVQARLPLIAQITGAVALTALLAAPWWSSIPEAPTEAESAAAARPAAVPPPATAPATAAATPSPVPAPASVAPASAVPTPALAPEDLRPAHLNLEVRHSFANVDFSVTVDGKPAFQTTVEGSGKRFKVFGKRSERGYTKTIDLPPGVRLVRVRVLSAADKFDQARVERFDLGSASVATLRVSADRSGLSLVAERPPAPKSAPGQPPVQAAVPVTGSDCRADRRQHCSFTGDGRAKIAAGSQLGRRSPAVGALGPDSDRRLRGLRGNWFRGPGVLANAPGSAVRRRRTRTPAGISERTAASPASG